MFGGRWESGGRRFYPNPTDPTNPYLSVTTVLDMVGSVALKIWATNLTAATATTMVAQLVAATLIPDCARQPCKHDSRETCPNCPCGQCLPCLTRYLRSVPDMVAKRRADEGTDLHEVARYWVASKGVLLARTGPSAPYITQWQQWVKDYGLTPDSWDAYETVVVNSTHRYAGTLDEIVTFRRTDSPLAAEIVDRVKGPDADQVRLIGDNKTRENPNGKIYPKVALQLAGYRYAERVRLADDTEVPMPEVDGAFVLQLRPDGYTMRLVDAGPQTWEAFLGFLRGVEWDWRHGTAAVSPRGFPLPPKPDTKPKRAPRKRAAKKAPPPPPAVPASDPITDIPF